MNKPLLGLILGGILGIFDGLSSLISGPEVAPKLAFIVVASSSKGLVAGLIIGFVARKLQSLPLGIIAGLIVSVLITLPFALGTDPDTGKQYFWEIMLPGAALGLIVGFATQQYGKPPRPKQALS